MTLKECFHSLEIPDAAEAIGVEWENSQATLPKDISFLNPEFLKTTVRKYFDDREVEETVLDASLRLKQNEAALRLLWHQHYLVVQNYERHWLKCYKFPELPALGRDARSFYLLLALSGADYFHGVHENLGISFDLLKPTIEEIRTSIEMSVEKKGLLGLAPHYSGWWQGFFSGRLYRLGRLTFLSEKYTFPFHAFANKKGEMKILAADGLNFTEQGLCQLKDETLAWQSQYEEKDGHVHGQWMSANGFAKDEAVDLSLGEWQPLVKTGEPTVSVHITAGEPMEIGACIQSFSQAKTFFEKYFPKTKFRLFTCDSWLLDPQLRKVLKDSSNIVQFQKRFWLAPSPMDAEFVPIRTIFGTEALSVGFDGVPHETGLQKGAAKLKKSGATLRHGFGLHPWDKPWSEEIH